MHQPRECSTRASDPKRQSPKDPRRPRTARWFLELECACGKRQVDGYEASGGATVDADAPPEDSSYERFVQHQGETGHHVVVRCYRETPEGFVLVNRIDLPKSTGDTREARAKSPDSDNAAEQTDRPKSTSCYKAVRQCVTPIDKWNNCTCPGCSAVVRYSATACEFDIEGEPRSEYFDRELGEASMGGFYGVDRCSHRLRHIGIDRGRARFHVRVCSECDAIFACMVADYRNERYYEDEFRRLESYSSWLESGMSPKSFDWGPTDPRRLDLENLPKSS